MNVASASLTKPSDFVIFDSYENKDKIIVEGDFPIYVKGVSVCCQDERTKHITAVPVIISNAK